MIMKKCFLITLTMFSINAYGKQLDHVEYRDKFREISDESFYCVDPYKCVQLLNKIEVNKSKSKEKILLMMLEMEIDYLEDKINRIEEVKNLHGWSDKDGEKIIIGIEDGRKIISGWREKYLSNPRRTTNEEG